ncbi:hypothetical protein BGZ72_001312 [Mortierella alpina]|nr:hypothetical protein BGZ72_001312 [Mortierella alpina]
MDKDKQHARHSKNEDKSGKKASRRPVWSADVKELPGSLYVVMTDPKKYNFHDYVEFSGARSTDRLQYSSLWRSTILPRLTTSQFPVLRDVGRQLDKKWIQEKAANDLFWSRLEEKELEDEQQRRSMSTLKA